MGRRATRISGNGPRGRRGTRNLLHRRRVGGEQVPLYLQHGVSRCGRGLRSRRRGRSGLGVYARNGSAGDAAGSCSEAMARQGDRPRARRWRARAPGRPRRPWPWKNRHGRCPLGSLECAAGAASARSGKRSATIAGPASRSDDPAAAVRPRRWTDRRTGARSTLIGSSSSSADASFVGQPFDLNRHRRRVVRGMARARPRPPRTGAIAIGARSSPQVARPRTAGAARSGSLSILPESASVSAGPPSGGIIASGRGTGFGRRRRYGVGIVSVTGGRRLLRAGPPPRQGPRTALARFPSASATSSSMVLMRRSATPAPSPSSCARVAGSGRAATRPTGSRWRKRLDLLTHRRIEAALAHGPDRHPGCARPRRKHQREGTRPDFAGCAQSLPRGAGSDLIPATSARVSAIALAISSSPTRKLSEELCGCGRRG